MNKRIERALTKFNIPLDEFLKALEPVEPVLRASAAPRAVKCPASIFEPPAMTDVEPFSEEGALGTAAHDYAKMLVNGEQLPNVPQMALHAQVDEDDLRYLTYSARSMWSKIGTMLPNAVAEGGEGKFAAINGVKITGHYDVLAHSEEQRMAGVLDWKTGWKLTKDYRPQIKTYGLLAMMTVLPATVNRLWAGIGWLRNGIVEGDWYDRDEILAWGEHLSATIEEGRKMIYHPGDHCQYCPAAGTCMGQIQWLLTSLPVSREDLAIEMQLLADKPKESGTVLAQKLRAATQLEQRCESFRQALRAFLTQWGPLDTTEGRKLGLWEKKRMVVDPPRGWSVLSEKIGMDNLLECVKISLPDVLDMVKSKTSRGKKQEAANTFKEELVKDGIVQPQPYFEVREVDKEETNAGHAHGSR